MKFVAYTRVSTQEQDNGLEAQRIDIERYVAQHNGKLAAIYVEKASGGDNDRPELAKAIARARATRSALIVSTVSRLSRDAAFILTTVAALESAQVEFICADNPRLNRFTLTIYAAMVEEERRLIGERTRKALAVLKANGKALGGMRSNSHELGQYRHLGRARQAQNATAWANDVMKPTIEPMIAEGVSLNEMARRLNADEIPTQRGSTWTAKGVSNVIARF